ncbi:unnamed protein product [Trichogramma brassicae]|uniref:Retrotransposon gag domain-containing protein n=1 Tax=Trichogramma brassicae TaxID=86971 RepID=A0A6H5IHD7_9HYME|nr:unnamed protein product [Trichogramma brassicae]
MGKFGCISSSSRARGIEEANRRDEKAAVDQRRETQRHRDIGELVRRWKIQFDGFGQMSVESFIERVEECGFLAGLTDRDLLLGLSETLTGTAAKWYRSNRYSFRTWDDFCKAARRMFGIDRYGHQQLLEQIKKRTQGPDERVAEYIICIQSVFSKLRPELDVQTQLDYLHGGMLPDLQKMVCRRFLRSIDDLLEEAVEAENTIRKANQYRAPTSDENTWPELRYKPGKCEDTSYRISSLSNPNDEVSTLMQAQIEATQRLSESVKELQSRLTSLEERFCEKKQTELLQKISESMSESHNHNCNPSGKPDGQKHQGKRKSTHTKKSVSSTQQAGMQPSSPAENKMKKTREIRCYGCGVPNVYRKNCTTCSENGAIGKAAGNLKRQQILAQAQEVTPDEKNETHSSSGNTNVTEDLEGHWWMQVQVGGKEVRGLYDTGGNRTTMTEIAAQFAQKCGRTITSVHSRRTRCANDSASVVTGFVDLPFTIGGITRDVRVDIMPDLWTNCLLGSNFIRTFQTIHNPITNECIVGLNEASVPMEFVADQSKISAIGLVEMTQRGGKRSRVHLNKAKLHREKGCEHV